MKLTWAHDKKVGFDGIRPALTAIRDGLIKQIDAEKAKLAQMVGARDSLKKQ